MRVYNTYMRVYMARNRSARDRRGAERRALRVFTISSHTIIISSSSSSIIIIIIIKFYFYLSPAAAGPSASAPETAAVPKSAPRGPLGAILAPRRGHEQRN